MRNKVYTVLGIEFIFILYNFRLTHDLEYSEIDESHRNARGDDGNLVFSASHTVISNFDLEFLKSFCESKLGTLSYVHFSLA